MGRVVVQALLLGTLLSGCRTGKLVEDGQTPSFDGATPGQGADARTLLADASGLADTAPPDAGPVLSKDWAEQRFVPEAFTASVGSGPSWGPVEEVGAEASYLTGDKAGNIYLVNGQAIDIVTPRGLRQRLAGTEEAGFIDGPAEVAQFAMGVGAYYGATNIQADGRGNIFVPDNGNLRVRRIFKDSAGKWMVETWAGGGKRTLNPGESASPRDVVFAPTMIIAVDQAGTVTVATTWLGSYRITPDGETITRLADWPRYAGATAAVAMNWQGGDSDEAGNAYFVSRTPDVVYRVSASGKVEHIGGLPSARGTNAGDGPPLSIYFDTPDSGCACPDGSCVYVCGGDEYDIRRVPTDTQETSATLAHNGAWYVMEQQPKGQSGNVFDPAATGPSRFAGGQLQELLTCHLLGRDYAGNLYGSLYPWAGTTLAIKGQGLLGTRVYRLRRTQ